MGIKFTKDLSILSFIPKSLANGDPWNSSKASGFYHAGGAAPTQAKWGQPNNSDTNANSGSGGWCGMTGGLGSGSSSNGWCNVSGGLGSGSSSSNSNNSGWCHLTGGLGKKDDNNGGWGSSGLGW